MAVTGASQRYILTAQGDTIPERLKIGTIRVISIGGSGIVTLVDNNSVAFYHHQNIAVNAVEHVNFDSGNHVDGIIALALPANINVIIYESAT